MTKRVQDPSTPGRNIWTELMTQNIDSASKRLISPPRPTPPSGVSNLASSFRSAIRPSMSLKCRDASLVGSIWQTVASPGISPRSKLGSSNVDESHSPAWSRSPQLPTSACIARVPSKRHAANKDKCRLSDAAQDRRDKRAAIPSRDYVQHAPEADIVSSQGTRRSNEARRIMTASRTDR